MRDEVPIELTEAAGDWFDILSQGEVSAKQRAEFVDWINCSPQHIAEFLRVSALYTELSGSLSDFPEWTEDLLSYEPMAVIPISDLTDAAELSEIDNDSKVDLPVRPQRSRAWLATAAMLLIAVFVGVVVTEFGNSTRLVTSVGEQRVVMLDDGSRLQLNTNSEVKVLFRDKVRELKLLRGEIFIDVEKDYERPFIVTTDTAVIQATGTQFNVYWLNSATEVTVIEGSVLVNWSPSNLEFGSAAADQKLALELDVGQKTKVVKNEAIPKPTVVDISKAIAWTQRRLVFENELVATIADEFNRYNKIQLIVPDPELASARISGVFDVNDPKAFTALLDSLHGLDIQVTERNDLRLEYKSDGSK
jgi:transmembrane sensor